MTKYILFFQTEDGDDRVLMLDSEASVLDWVNGRNTIQSVQSVDGWGSHTIYEIKFENGKLQLVQVPKHISQR